MLLADDEFRKMWALCQPSFTQGRQLISVHIFHISCPVWVKFGAGDQHMMLLNMCEFRENRRSEGCTFLWT
jgi:hypothetical protein